MFMKGIIKFLLFLVVVGLMSCGGGAYDGLNREQTRIAKDVAKRYNQFISKIESKEFDHLEDYFSADDRFTWEIERSREGTRADTEFPERIELVETLKESYESVSRSKLNSTPGKVTVYNENMVYIFAMYNQTDKLKTGETKKYYGAISAYMIKEGGTWRFLKGSDQNGLR